MSDDILTGEGSDEGESLSDTIAAALEDQQGDDLISELGEAQDAAGETQEADGQALPDDEGGVETPDHGGADRTGQTDPPLAAAREATDDGPERSQAAEAYEAAVEPFTAYLASKGVKPAQAVRILLAAEHQLSTGTPEQKALIFSKLAKDYGIDLYALADSAEEDAEPGDPELAKIQQRIGGIERLINSQRQQAAAQIQQNAEAQVVAFAEGKDAGGNLLRPHLEKVRATMGRMIGEDPNLTLQAAYDNAVWADPKLRKAALAKQRAAPTAKRNQHGKAKATAKPAKEMSLYDTVVEAHRSAIERADA